MKQLPARRQTLLFSATLPPPIVALAREMLRDPVAVNVGRPATPATGITQTAYPVPRELKSALLLELLKRPEIASVLAFTRTKHRANRLAEFLLRHGITADRIHGNRSQAQRTQALARFKTRRVRVLVATDIAARGIDIVGLSHVLNFDVPGGPEDYVHRIGRTARAEALGDALTLVAPDEEPSLREIEQGAPRRASSGPPSRASTTRRGRPSASRSRWRSASRPSASGRPGSARHRGRRAARPGSMGRM